MKLLDRIALNTLVKTITNFILSLIKILYPSKIDHTPVRKKPLKDLLDRLINK